MTTFIKSDEHLSLRLYSIEKITFIFHRNSISQFYILKTIKLYSLTISSMTNFKIYLIFIITRMTTSKRAKRCNQTLEQTKMRMSKLNKQNIDLKELTKLCINLLQN